MIFLHKKKFDHQNFPSKQQTEKNIATAESYKPPEEDYSNFKNKKIPNKNRN